MEKSEIAILDFGSQYTHLIARKIRELGVISHIYPNDVPAGELKNAGGIILSGGPRSVVHEPILPYDPKLFELNVPVLGLCYGHQLMAKIFGGKLSSGSAREYGLATIEISTIPYAAIFKNVNQTTTVWMSHGDHVEELPPGFEQIASTGNKSVAAMANETKKLYGFQFHPEVAHSKQGKLMIKNFVFDICGMKKNWTTKKMLSEIENKIKIEASKKVFLLVSGGVDSTVCFALLEKVLGKKRVYGLHVDTGLMRQGETKKIQIALKKIGFDNLHVYNAEKEFLKALKGVTEPEQKRKIIGDLFLDITDRIMREKKLDDDKWLIGQGTIYPDTIESGGTKNADVIKTHHNRVPRIKQMILDGKIIEPIKELYKDEVRVIGRELGLPNALVDRHPFPGPGLAIRCLCSDGSKDKVVTYKLPTISYLKLPIQSVGVQGDERSYAHPALIIEKNDWKLFETLSPTITNQHKDINRVLALISGDKESLLKSDIKKADLSKKRLEILRKIDTIVHDIILKEPSCKKIWQMPVVLVPFGYKHKESIVLRPVESAEAMTVTWSKIPEKILKKIIKKINTLNVVDFIFYDITNKPPGTIEWE